MKRPVLFGILLIGASILVSCDSEFNPKGSYEERVVLYSILMTRTDTQYVRLYTTYDPPAFDPQEVTNEQPIRNATVVVRQGGTAYQFRDTMVTRDDPQRYGGLVPAYVAYPFRVTGSQVYSMSVESPTHGSITASTTVPGRGDITVLNPFVLRSPQSFNENIIISARISPPARGFLLKMFIDYEVRFNQIWSPRRVEVPREVVETGEGRRFVYPQLVRRTTVPVSAGSLNAESVVFTRAGYEAVLQQLFNDFGSENLRFSQVVLVLTQVDENLYTYYNLANGFQDEFSIRTDQPDYSNIRGGYGVFGSMTEDSTVVSLRE